MPHNDDDVQAVVRMLSRYWRDHPLASDTPDGIASWWLRLDWHTHESTVVAALAWLSDAALIEGVEGPDGRVRYRRIPGPQADATLGALAGDTGGGGTPPTH